MTTEAELAPALILLFRRIDAIPEVKRSAYAWALHAALTNLGARQRATDCVPSVLPLFRPMPAGDNIGFEIDINPEPEIGQTPCGSSTCPFKAL